MSIQLPKAIQDAMYRVAVKRGFEDGETRGVFCPACGALVWSTSDDLGDHDCDQVEAH